MIPDCQQDAARCSSKSDCAMPGQLLDDSPGASSSTVQSFARVAVRAAPRQHRARVPHTGGGGEAGTLAPHHTEMDQTAGFSAHGPHRSLLDPAPGKLIQERPSRCGHWYAQPHSAAVRWHARCAPDLEHRRVALPSLARPPIPRSDANPVRPRGLKAEGAQIQRAPRQVPTLRAHQWSHSSVRPAVREAIQRPGRTFRAAHTGQRKRRPLRQSGSRIDGEGRPCLQRLGVLLESDWHDPIHMPGHRPTPALCSRCVEPTLQKEGHPAQFVLVRHAAHPSDVRAVGQTVSSTSEACFHL